MRSETDPTTPGKPYGRRVRPLCHWGHAFFPKQASASVPATIKTPATAKPSVGETAVQIVPTIALETNLVMPLTVPSAP
jgi:hypothetical protein